MTAYWVGVASREHVLAAVAGGFCQLNHGKEAPLHKLQPGDGLLYYSPKERIRDGEIVQAFTAVGKISPEAPYPFQQSERFHPFRRRVDYAPARQASIRPLLPDLNFTRSNPGWGQVLRRDLFLIDACDFALIAGHMRAPVEAEQARSGVIARP